MERVPTTIRVYLFQPDLLANQHICDPLCTLKSRGVGIMVGCSLGKEHFVSEVVTVFDTVKMHQILVGKCYQDFCLVPYHEHIIELLTKLLPSVLVGSGVSQPTISYEHE